MPAALVAAFFILLLFEMISPLRRRTRRFPPRFLVNLCMTMIAFVAGGLVVRSTALSLAEWVSERPVGFLQVLPLPFAVQFAIGFLLMDFTFYHWHRVNHTIGVLWRFHNVHHIDPDLDVSTSFRFHVGEILYSAGFRALQVLLLGISPITYVVYEMVFQCATMFHHSNLRLPVRFERWLNKIVVTPRMHGIHHSIIKNETNSNYSVVFRWWDILHRTLRLNIPQSKIRVGVAAYRRPEDNKLWHLIVMPFLRQRDYWRFPNGTTAVRDEIDKGPKPKGLLE